MGFAAIGPDVADRLHLDAPALAAARWPAAGLFGGEAAIAARAGWAQAVLELEAAGPAALARLVAERALAVRRRLAQMPGWRVREPADDYRSRRPRRDDSSPARRHPDPGAPKTAATRPPSAPGCSPTACSRAPSPPNGRPGSALPAALRVSVHAWTTDDDADALADALAAAVPRG